MANRAERRRNKSMDKPKTYVLTQDQINQIKQQAVDEAASKLRETAYKEAVTTSFSLLMSIPKLVLHDKFGFGNIRMNRFMDYVMVWYESVQSGETKLSELVKITEEYSDTKLIVEG